MKRLSAALLAGLLLSSSIPAWADGRDREHARYYQPDRHARYERYDHRGDNDRNRGHRHGNAVLGVLGAGLVLGAIALAAEPYRPPPAPLVVVPVRPAAGVWNYCASSGAYYPYVEYCPEGWRAVPATP
jgi:hypothetical protein